MFIYIGLNINFVVSERWLTGIRHWVDCLQFFFYIGQGSVLILMILCVLCILCRFFSSCVWTRWAWYVYTLSMYSV